MSWNDDKNGPWGPASSGDRQPRRFGKGSEDPFEALRQTFSTLFGGSGGAGEDNKGGRNGKAASFFVALGVLAVVIFQSAFTVAPDQIGIVTRFGAYQAPPRPPGLNFMFWPIDSVRIVQVTAENLEEIGYRTRSTRSGQRERAESPEEALMLTKDENIVSVGFNVTWAVKTQAPQDFLFNVYEVPQTIRAVAESAMREVVSKNKAEDVITRGQSILQADVIKIMQDTLDAYGAGVQVTNVTISRPEAPPAVREAYNDVQQAAQDAQTFQNQARRDANKVLAEARADAAQKLQEADGYAKRVVAEAKGEASRFSAVYAEYRTAKAVTQQRLYLETMEKVFGNANKVVMDKAVSGSGLVPYLPLPHVQRYTEGER